MSIPHTFVSAPGASATSSAPINSKKLQPLNSSPTSKEHIRERLNMHVKKRIQGQDIMSQYPMSASPAFSTPLNPTHPFLMSGAPNSMPQMVVFANSLISVASDYSTNMGRTIIDRQSVKIKQQPKKLSKKKKSPGNKKKIKHVDFSQQAENLIMNAKYSDDSNECHDRGEVNNSLSPQNNTFDQNDQTDQKLSNNPDILSMVLSLKKNALMHDPYVIQFISSIR